MFKKLLDWAEKLINRVEKDRERQAQKIRNKQAAYLAERRKQAEAEQLKAYKQEIERRKAQRIHRLSSYTDFAEFKSLIESPQYKRLSDDDRDLFLKRANDLRKQNPQFAKDYQAWQNEKSKKVSMPTNNRDIPSI